MITDTQFNSTVSNKIEKVIKALTKRKITFSADNVIKIARKIYGPLGSYNFLRDMVLSLFINNNKKFSSVYERILMAVQLPEGRKRIWVYYHKNNNPFDYNPEENIDIRMKDKDIYYLTGEGRLNIGKKFIEKIGMSSGHYVYLSFSEKENKIIIDCFPEVTDVINPGDQKQVKINKDCRIRLNKNLLNEYFIKFYDENDGFYVSLEYNKIDKESDGIIADRIVITPVI